MITSTQFYPIKWTLIAYLLTTGCSVMAQDHFKLLRKEGYLTYYTGSATLTGKVSRLTDEESNELMGDQLCFTPLGKSEKFIPRVAGDSRAPWFCFSNFATAIHILKLPKHPETGACGYEADATVVVRDYIVNTQESEVFDTAILIAATKRSPIVNIPCN